MLRYVRTFLGNINIHRMRLVWGQSKTEAILTKKAFQRLYAVSKPVAFKANPDNDNTQPSCHWNCISFPNNLTAEVKFAINHELRVVAKNIDGHSVPVFRTNHSLSSQKSIRSLGELKAALTTVGQSPIQTLSIRAGSVGGME